MLPPLFAGVFVAKRGSGLLPKGFWLLDQGVDGSRGRRGRVGGSQGRYFLEAGQCHRDWARRFPIWDLGREPVLLTSDCLCLIDWDGF